MRIMAGAAAAAATATGGKVYVVTGATDGIGGRGADVERSDEPAHTSAASPRSVATRRRSRGVVATHSTR